MAEAAQDPLHRFAAGAGLATVALGLVVMLGWVLGSPLLRSVSPTFPSMKVNTALSFVASGLCLYLVARGAEGRARAVVSGLSLVVAFVSLATLFQYAAGLDFGIDEAFIKDPDTVLTSHPGRQSPLTSVGFTLLAGAYLVLVRPTAARRFAQAAIAALGLVCLFAAAGYLFAIEPFFGATQASTGIAVHTLLGLIVLGAGVEALLPVARGVYEARETAATRLLLRLLAAAVVVPLLLSYLVDRAADAGLFSRDVRLAILTVGTVGILVALVVPLMGRLRDAEVARLRAYEDLRENFRDVEQEVRERTSELQRLLAERERLVRIVNASRDAIVSLDSTGHVVTWNPAAERIFGLPVVDAIGRHFFDAAKVEERELQRAILDKLIRDRKAATERFTFIRPDGSRVPGALSAFPLVGAGGRVIGAAGVVRDMQKETALEEALLRSNRDLQRFAYVASHDLRAPLRHAEGYAMLLEKQHNEELSEGARHRIEQMLAAIARGQRLIDGLLALSRVEGRGKPAEWVPARKLVDAALDLIEPALKEADPTIRIGELPDILVDEDQVIDVFRNLLENAVKYRSPERRLHVEVSARPAAEGWEFSVADNGGGFDSRHAERIFGMFQRLATRDEAEGTGMGLAIVRRIVERHGGSVWAEGRPGEGATFYFTLPNRPLETG